MLARRLSLVSGLYLFLFVFAHLINLSLGLISLTVMEDARSWLIAPWTNPVGGGLLFAALLVHIALGLRALFRRNTLQLNQFDWFQLLLGLSIPLLLFPHFVAVGLMVQLADIHLSYRDVLKVFWVNDLWLGVRQVLGLLAVWLHSCMGLFIWMRLQSWWNTVSILVYPTVVLLPALALLGFVEAGKVVIAEHNSAAATSEPEVWSRVDPQVIDTIKLATNGSVIGYLLLLLLVLALRELRLRFGSGRVEIRVAGFPSIETASGTTLLEVSRMNEISHASLCGGKGRCGTCQVRIINGRGNLAPRTTVEDRKLESIGAADDIRLACQAHTLGGEIHLERILPGYVEAQDMPVNSPAETVQ